MLFVGPARQDQNPIQWWLFYACFHGERAISTTPLFALVQGGAARYTDFSVVLIVPRSRGVSCNLPVCVPAALHRASVLSFCATFGIRILPSDPYLLPPSRYHLCRLHMQSMHVPIR